MALGLGLPLAGFTALSAPGAEAEIVAAVHAEQSARAEVGAAAAADTLRAFQSGLLIVADSRLAQVGATRGDEALLLTVLQEFRPLLAGTRTLHFVGTSGAVLAADPPSEPYSAPLQQAVLRGATTFDAAFPAVVAAVPVRDGFGAQVGTLVGRLALRDLLDAAARGDPEAYLVAPDGRAVLRSLEGVVLADAGPPAGSIVASAPVADAAWQVAVPRSRDEMLAPLPGRLAQLLAFRLLLAAALGLVAYVVASIARDLVLERRRLIASNQLLAAAGRHKTEFLANVNHELRTPLSSIIGFAALLAEGAPLDERQARYVRNIRASGDQLLGLVDEILELAALESGSLTLKRERVLLGRVLAGPIAVARAVAESRDLRLEVEVAADVEVLVDQRRLEHALTLLAASACDATPQGGLVGIAVQIDGHALVISLADGGPAVARERAARVFDVYGRIREGTGGPSGPGLALAKRLVELHGGTLRLEGGDGTGAVIALRLPDVIAVVT